MYRVLVTAAMLGTVFLTAPVTHAAYPGENGRIAFVSSGQIWTVNGDGSDLQQVTSPTSPAFDADPSWSPDGTRIAFSRGSSSRDLYIVNANGSGATLLTTNGQDPTWSPDGTEIAFVSPPGFDTSLYRINVDGTNRHLEANIAFAFECCVNDPAWSPRGSLIAFRFVWTEPVCDPFDPGGECDPVSDNYLGVRAPGHPEPDAYSPIEAGSDPDWAPTAAEIVHETEEIRVDYYTWAGTDGDIAAVTADGSNSRTIVSGAEIDSYPAWSPDGSSIVFQRSGTGLWVVPAAGGTPVQILNHGTQPDWQPMQRPHVRPKGATPFRVSLVPAMKPCTAPNREHGPPLAFGSCNPPQPQSPNVTVSQGDARLRSVGSVRMDVLAGPPGGPDDSDVQIRFSLTNVMNSADFSDYTDTLTASTGVRRTDRDAGQTSTTQDFDFAFPVACSPTADTFLGSTCAATTSFDAIVPGSAAEGSRAIWALERLEVYDDQGLLFATQGVFVP